MKRVYAFTVIFVLFTRLPVSATIINIPDDYPTIQEGIDASIDGDTVLVQPGIYVENINFYGHNIVLGSLFLITEDTTYISETVIDGDSSGSVVCFESEEDSTAIIIGFSIRNGANNLGAGIKCVNGSNPAIRNNMISENYAWRGGGIFVDQSDPIILDNKIIGNSSEQHGGGIFAAVSRSIINDNIFKTNSAECGGAICCERADPIIINNTMVDNTVSYLGGGFSCLFDSNPTISNNRIGRNTADYGGGIAFEHADGIIHNNIIFANSADGGGGLYFSVGSDPIISNNTIWGNSALIDFGRGGGIYSHSNSNPTIINTIFWADSALYSGGDEIYLNESFPSITYSNIQGGWEGEGNIDTDPLFRDPENGDFHLMSTECGDSLDSPCIDTGSLAIIDSLLDCDWGLGTTLSDMGAYGGGDSVTVGIDEFIELLPERLTLLQNYPNPFNANTNISFTLPKPSDIIIEIYNILGQRVATLFDDHKPAGLHSVNWNADDYPSGVYFAKMRAGEKSQNTKMVLLK
ncbi:MAG: right-handed parallel beta-helix repeat-containing protein [candidate division Zixibacteria bacterium]